MIAEAIAKALGGYRRNGKNHLCRCPAHDDGSPSLSLADGEDGRLLVKCFAGCGGAEIIRILKSRGLLGDTVARRLEAPRPKPMQDTSRDWSPRAARILGARQLLRDSIGENYLNIRNCDIPDCAALAFLPVMEGPDFPRHCREYPSILATVTDATTGKPITLHFTFLEHDGSGKAPIPKDEQRHLLAGHRSGGGVIRLVDEADITYGLGLAEGIETALSVMKSGWRPVWAAVNAGNMATFPVRGSSQSLTLFADNDESGTGLNAANKCAARWHTAGREVRIVMPDQRGSDWNG